MVWSERLSNLDATFLYLEDRTAHMHVGAVAIFEGTAPSYDDMVRLIASRLDRVPRYRQRLALVPFNLGRPVWIDESELDLEYHVRHTALPAPGDDEQLKKLAGRLFAQRLDRDKPLWEMWLIEGLVGNRFAILSKTHHCMIDGVSGVDLATVLLDADSRVELPAASPWTPRPAPSRTELVSSAIRDQVRHPIELAREAFEPTTEGRKLLLELLGGVKPLLGMAQMGLAPVSSLNRPLSPHRRWEMLDLPLAEVKNVRAALGGTVNDVILAVVAGALRELLVARGDELTDLRVMVPVSVRSPEARGTFGNQVTAIFCDLPVTEPDAVERLHKVTASMRGLKESHQAMGALALSRLGEFSPPTLVAQASRLVMRHTRVLNLVVTNVPGPQFPLYFLGKKLAGCYPCVPLAPNQAVGIALLSYDGRIGIGLLGDAEQMRDLTLLREAIPRALRTLSLAH